MVILRTFARRVQERAIAAQDIFCWFSLATYVSYVGLYLNILDTLYEITAVASGKMAPPPDFQANGNRIMIYFFAIQLLFWLTIYSVKISLLCLVRRLTQGVPLYEKVWIAVLAFTLLTFVGCVITELTSCQPLKSYFILGTVYRIRGRTLANTTAGACTTTRDANAQAASLYFSLAVDLITDLMSKCS